MFYWHSHVRSCTFILPGTAMSGTKCCRVMLKLISVIAVYWAITPYHNFSLSVAWQSKVLCDKPVLHYNSNCCVKKCYECCVTPKHVALWQPRCAKHYKFTHSTKAVLSPRKSRSLKTVACTLCLKAAHFWGIRQPIERTTKNRKQGDGEGEGTAATIL